MRKQTTRKIASRLARTGLLILVTGILVTSMAHAAATPYTTRADFDAAAGPTRIIDFATNDSGNPLSSPSADILGPFGLSGVCFQGARSYYNNLFYTWPGTTMVAGLPSGTYAFGTDIGTFYPVDGTHTVTLSTGEVFQFGRHEETLFGFFGVVSDTPIQWVTFVYDNTYPIIDNFAITSTAGPGGDCPPGPIISDVLANPNPIETNTVATLTANVDHSTPGGSNIASAEYTIDSGSGVPMDASDSAFDEVTEEVTVDVPGQAPGVYEICVSGTDTTGNTGDAECILVPVYDPEGGFVTGGGWVESPGSADLVNGASGPARFGFVSKYLPGRSTPDGNLEFRFKAGDIRFHSTNMEWLVVTGEPRAMFRGDGLLNDQSTCKFEVDAWDESLSGEDGFGLKLFACGPGADVNRYWLPATTLGGGNIKIHQN